jgi:hypothetical protein
MKSVGILLIALGMFAAAATASLSPQAEKAGKPARERFLESVGGALFCLVLVVPGVFLALAGGKKCDGKYRPPPPPRSAPAAQPAGFGTGTDPG